MKKIIFLFFLILGFYSCETEDVNDTVEIIQNEQLILNTTSTRKDSRSLSVQEHKAMLAWNSFIIGEVLRLSPTDESYILNSINPITHTVSMNVLLNQSTNSLFYDHYTFIATHAYINAESCTKPGGQDPWPPFDSSDPFNRNNKSTSVEVAELLQNLITHNTELYIPNNTTAGNIYTVGHPLTAGLNNTGTMIFDPPYKYSPSLLGRCTRYSQPSNVGANNQVNNNLILLSRPNLSGGNPYPYINFDIKRYLQDLGDPDSDDPYIGGPQF